MPWKRKPHEAAPCARGSRARLAQPRLPALPRIAAGLDQWLGGGTPVLLDICVLSDQFAGRQHRLRSDLGTRSIKGKVLEQWQYEVTGAGRIWYCPDDALRVVFITKDRARATRAKLIELMMAAELVIVSS